MLTLTSLIEFAHNHTGQGCGEAHGSFSLMVVSCLLTCTCHSVGSGVMRCICFCHIIYRTYRRERETEGSGGAVCRKSDT